MDTSTLVDMVPGNGGLAAAQKDSKTGKQQAHAGYNAVLVEVPGLENLAY